MKDQNNFAVHRTRPIPLVEADMNENSKRMARDAMVAAEMYDLIIHICFYKRNWSRPVNRKVILVLHDEDINNLPPALDRVPCTIWYVGHTRKDILTLLS